MIDCDKLMERKGLGRLCAGGKVCVQEEKCEAREDEKEGGTGG